MTETLLPCPFCGVTPHIKWEPWTEISKTAGVFELSANHEAECFISAMNGTNYVGRMSASNKECLIAAWNRRTGKGTDVTTNNAAPVVRGEWIRMDETQALLSVEWKCSQCGQIRVYGILTAIGAGWKYCPNCGAKMEDNP